VLFDAAGTLVRLREPVGETYRRLAVSFGVSLPASRLEEAFWRASRTAPPMVFPGASSRETIELERRWWHGIVRSTFRAADSSARFADFEAYFSTVFAHFASPTAWEPTTGAQEILSLLRRRGMRTGVVSNFDHRLTGLLEGLGLAPEIEVVVLPADAGAAKPDPRIFAFALSRLGVGAEEAVYVGDDAVQDVAGAEGAGIRAIDVSSLATLLDLGPRLCALAKEKAV
jgi:putative hydrolase of the HAD superfamily